MGIFFKRNGIDVNFDGVFESASAEVSTYNLAIHAAIDIIAKSISKCEFQVYEKKELSKANNYFLFNYEPNPNQNATQFWYKVIEKLIFDGECLVIQHGPKGNKKFYVADFFETLKPNPFSEWQFTNVSLDGETINKTYKMSEVFYFSFSDKNIQQLLNKFYASYGKLIAASMGYYRKNKGLRYVFRHQNIAPKDKEEAARLEKHVTDMLASWISKDNAVLPLGNGQALEDHSSKVAVDSRDTRNLVNDIFEIVAIVFHIPKSILIGTGLETTDNLDNFITFTLEPIIALISDEVNRKYFGQTEMEKGNFFKIYANRIKHVDVVQSAQKLESLFRIGFSFNDILKILGEEPLQDAWSDERFVTKNYMTVANSLKGGE